jgi:hypothetical protein
VLASAEGFTTFERHLRQLGEKTAVPIDSGQRTLLDDSAALSSGARFGKYGSSIRF